MKAEEFKAWFEGFTEAMDGPPTKKQWKRIQERVAQIDGNALTIAEIQYWWPRYVTTYTNGYPFLWGSSVQGSTTVSGLNPQDTVTTNLVTIGQQEYADVQAD